MPAIGTSEDGRRQAKTKIDARSVKTLKLILNDCLLGIVR